MVKDICKLAKKNNFKKIYYILYGLICVVLIYSNSTAESLDDANKLWWIGDYANSSNIYKKTVFNEDSKYDALINLATLYRSLGDYESAIKQYKKILPKLKNIDAKSLNHVYLPLAESYYYLNRLSKAQEIYEDIFSKNPDSPDILFGLGRVYYSRRKLSKAEKFLKRVIKINSKYPGCYFYLAKIYEKQKRLIESSKMYAKALKKDSHQIELRYSLGNNYQERGLNEKAYKQFHRLKNVDSKNSYVLAKIDETIPYLKDKPENIIKSKTRENFSPMRNVIRPEKIPRIKVGINSTHRGKLLTMKTLSFKASTDFYITYKGKTVYVGEKEKNYSIYRKSEKNIIGLSNNNVLSELPEAFEIQPQNINEGSIILKKIEYARGFAWAGIEDRQYRGRIRVVYGNDGYKLINEINLEEYLYGVVPSEMMISFPVEALNAQAVIARSYAYYRMNYIHPHKKDNFDLCDSQHCQVYKGISNEWRKTNNAIDSTRGEMLYYKTKVTHPLFHSNCGGHTITSGNLKGWGHVGYLTGCMDSMDEITFPTGPVDLEKWIKSKPKVFCNVPKYGWEPEFRWFRLVPVSLLEEKINRQKNIGKIEKIIINKRNPSGHVRSVTIKGTKSNLLLEKEHKIRRYLAIGPLRSNLFWLDTKYDSSGIPQEFIFYGGGWGHGVGMCQSGAAGMAEYGHDYKEIIYHYYKNTKVKKINY